MGKGERAIDHTLIHNERVLAFFQVRIDGRVVIVMGERWRKIKSSNKREKEK